MQAIKDITINFIDRLPRIANYKGWIAGAGIVLSGLGIGGTVTAFQAAASLPAAIDPTALAVLSIISLVIGAITTGVAVLAHAGRDTQKAENIKSKLFFNPTMLKQGNDVDYSALNTASQSPIVSNDIDHTHNTTDNKTEDLDDTPPKVLPHIAQRIVFEITRDLRSTLHKDTGDDDFIILETTQDGNTTYTHLTKEDMSLPSSGTAYKTLLTAITSATGGTIPVKFHVEKNTLPNFTTDKITFKSPLLSQLNKKVEVERVNHDNKQDLESLLNDENTNTVTPSTN